MLTFSVSCAVAAAAPNTSAAPGGASRALSKFMNDTKKAHNVEAWSIQPAACMTTKPAPPAKGWTYFQCKGWA